MNAKPVIAITLATVGAVVLASLSLDLLTPDKPVEFLGMNIAKGNGEFIPPLAGGLVFAGGILWLFVKPKRA